MKKNLVLLVVFLSSQVTAGLFNDRYPSPRATAMSGSFVAVSNDVWASFYNPAGLALQNQPAAGASYQMPFGLSFFNSYFFTALYPLPGKFGTASVSFENFGVSYAGNDLSAEYTFGLSHGFNLFQDIHSFLKMGYNLKYYHWSLSESVDGVDLGSQGAFGLDVGLLGSIYNRTYLGVYLLNINSPRIGDITSYDLPQRIVAGIAYRPIDNLITSLAFNKTKGFDTHVEGGLEYQFVEAVVFRLGVSTSPARFSAGIGINYSNIRFDYALRTHPVLSETHQFGLSYYFGGEQSQ